MSWRGIGPGSEAAKLGHDVIMSPTDNDYFDYYQTKNTWNEPLAFGGYLPVSKVYEFEPCPDSLSVEAKKHIIGVQSNLWTEYISTRNQVEYMIMPRIAATSEVQWTAPEKKNYPDFVKRVTRLTALYDCYGYQYAKHLWTEKELKE
jgi:hexosaminidase